MTPLTFTTPSRLVPLQTDSPAELAIMPLSFSAWRHCKNKEVLAAVIAVLSDKSSSDRSTVAIFRNAYEHNYAADLNQIIRNINALHGPGTVLTNKNVVALLADAGIELLQNSDGSVEMGHLVATRSFPDRHAAIRLGAGSTLCNDVLGLICSYDDEIDISAKNKMEILSILRSDDVGAKGSLLAAASHQHKIQYLNTVLSENGITLNLSGADLSNLDLSNLVLINANLCRANLRGTRLTKAIFYGSDLRYADLTNADLTQASLNSCDLRHARLIGANLYIANLADSNLNRALLLCADMRGAEMGDACRAGGALFNFANMKHLHFVDGDARSDFFLKYINGETGKRTAPDSAQSEIQTNGESLFEQAINRCYLGRLRLSPSEKNTLLAHGIATTENGDGTVRLQRFVITREDIHRHKIIATTMEQIDVPKVLAELIAGYDAEIEICEANRNAITDILLSTDQSAKAQLIATTSRQRNIPALNEILNALRFKAIHLDLSDVDLSYLDLTGINLTGVNLRCTNFQHSGLKRAQMHGAELSFAILNAADLTDAVLERADLSHARLIAAHLSKTRLRGANLFLTVLIGATLDSPGLYSQLVGSVVPFLHIKTNDFPPGRTLSHLNGPLTVSVVSGMDSEVDSPRFSPRVVEPVVSHPVIPISVAEKQLLAERGFRLIDNHNDTYEVSKPVLMYKNPDRAQLIESTLTGTLPTKLTDIISDYDVEIDISEANEGALLKILSSNDQAAKGELIAAASHQFQIRYLNTLFQKMRVREVPLDFSGVDLSNLSLRGINFDGAQLAGANLRLCDLCRATMRMTRLDGAVLCHATLRHAKLEHVNFSAANLSAADFSDASLDQVRFIDSPNITDALWTGASFNRIYADHATKNKLPLRMWMHCS